MLKPQVVQASSSHLLDQPEFGSEFYIVQRAYRRGGAQPDNQGKEITLSHINAGGFFGELSLIDGGVRTATVRTVHDSDLLTLGRDDFLRFVEKHPTVASQVIGELGKRQRSMLQMLRSVQNANEVMNEQQTFRHRFAGQLRLTDGFLDASSSCKPPSTRSGLLRTSA